MKGLIKSFCCLFLCIFSTNLTFAEYKKVVIVGAGLSGLTAAYRLRQMTGITPEVYEARPRVGGRVFTAHFNRSYAELGGKFIGEGGDSSRLKALIKELGLEIDDYVTTTPDRKYYFQGKVAFYYSPFYQGKKPNEANYALLRKWTQDSHDLDTSLKRFFAENDAALHLTEIRMRGYFGNDLEDLSTHYLDDFWQYYKKSYAISHGLQQNTTSHETIKGGNSLLPQKLSTSLKGHIHLNSPVLKISRSHDDKQFILEFPNAKVVTTDYLILTAPCSTLREIQFQGGIIPQDQWKAIKTLQYGTNGYVLMSVQLGNEDKAEYSVTEDAITWFNHDRTILCLDFGGQYGIFDAHSSEAVNGIINAEFPALKALFPSLKYTGKKQAISWINEKYSKGSICSWGVDQFEFFHETTHTLGETVRKVFRPIDDKLFFAGEHTALEYPGTMEGAVASGERVARMLSRILNQPPK